MTDTAHEQMDLYQTFMPHPTLNNQDSTSSHPSDDRQGQYARGKGRGIQPKPENSRF